MAALLAALVACNKEPQQVTPEDVDGKVYMQFSVNMLTTRSGTDGIGDTNSDASADYEVGKDRENKISKVDILLSNKDGSVVATVNNPEAATGVANTYIASFDSKSLTAGATYDVYIYANCSAPSPDDIDAISTETVTNMTKDNNFWMTNAYEAKKVTLPTDMSAHTQPNNPCNLGTHYVERSMARFDFMPKNDNKFEILKDKDVNATITLTEAALINQSKAFYMLRRVSDNGLPTGDNFVVGGTETAQNYVVDSDAAAKANGYVSTLAANFDYHLSLPAGDAENKIAAWDWKSIAAADLKEADSWEADEDGDGKTDYDGNHALNDYYIWQYAKENTIPGVDAQDHGISTGVVFKGEITGAAVENAGGKMIFVFENVLYGNWDAVKTAAAAPEAPATLLSAVNKINAIVDNPETTNVVETPTAADYAAAGFTGYNPDKTDHKYYAYYYYWNRHNDNGNNAEMGPMEFAVVRNNVYKLCVDKIAKFGHPDPTDPDNPDPDPVDPNDPDEELNYYFNVTVKVLPWVVRVNHIEF